MIEVNQNAMTGGQDHSALDRIEAALARIERAADALGEEHRGLQTRHATLREAVAGSLTEIDALIASRAETAVESPDE